MKHIIIKITMPDAVDPINVFENMTADFFYNNRHTEDIGPYMDEITHEIIEVKQ